MERTLGRQEASDAVSGLGWRYLLGALRTSVPVGSLTRAAEAATAAVAACGDDADQHLRVDLRPERVVLTLQSLDRAALTARDTELAHLISASVRAAGLRTLPETGTAAARSVQILEIAVDALDIAAVRPFWKAVFGYTDEPGADGPEDPLVDPVGQGPAIWFQQMDAPRPYRSPAASAAQPHPLRHLRPARRGLPADRGGAGRRRPTGLGDPRPGLLGAGRRRGERGLRDHLAGPGGIADAAHVRACSLLGVGRTRIH
jgi:4a-hydroxytetrahydrobiopterin dehydratase